MIGNFSQGFGDVRATARQGQVGDWAKVSHLNAFQTGINSVPQAAQVTTSTVTDPGDNVDITITINGVDVTYNTGTGGDADSIGAGLATAINAEPLVRGAVTATFDAGTDVLTLTGNLPGDTFTVTEASGALSAPSTTAAVVAEDIPFARVVVRTGQSPTGPEDLVGLAKLPRFTAQVATIAGYAAAAPDSGTRIIVTEVRGSERILLADVGVGGLNLTTDVATLQTALGARPVTVTESGADMVFTADVAGLEFEVEVAATAPVDVVATTGPSEATSLHRALIGISMYSPNDEAATIGGEEGRYVANRGVRVAVRGEVWVDSTQSPDPSDAVYVELADGSDSGKLFNTTSATRLALGRNIAQWRRVATPSTDAAAAVHLDTGRVP